ncbi:hypothetical protein LZQ00_06965 [Sphingobacterium sp. SRCM116780]|uniref:hypothetical protein n=1 Tax=Sphingobacterium sp. SRCM116780 TaxID=2907623 RepID=UPI001F1FC97D|nr:hypothetical protein [Sphingobacterium sp. SRCM116780]UIR57552.1 hypothetical protein LZQ00_06965 [Sphingobacterium sp. SRCM116780]
MEKGNSERRTSHILNTSANLLGICFLVLTSMKKMKLTEGSLIDEFAAVAVVIFMISCIISFIAMKRSDLREVKRLENIADIIFLSGLFVLFAASILLVFNLT